MLPVLVDDHLLWPDGTISVSPDKLIDYIYRVSNKGESVSKIYVTEMTDEIEAYNRLSEDQISVKDACQLKPLSWTLPDYYKYFDLNEYLFGLVDLIEQDELYDQRVSRLSTEIFAFKEAKLEEVLRTLIYVVDEMKKQNVVWGVGRGSSCSSYLLFLLGLHEVDPVKYDVDLTDFIR